MKTIKKAQTGTVAKPKAKSKPKLKPITGPTFVNLKMANQKSGTGMPATRRDSLDYKKGWERGLRGEKPSAMEKKYQGENEYEKMGRWEGQNKGKKNSVKKAKTGTSLGMKSVKAGFDNNPGVTRADIITAAKGKAKSGASVKKAKSGTKMKKAMMGAMAKPIMKAGGKMTKCKYGCK